MTKYTHRVTIAVPEALINEANHLACIMGEFAEDINTFQHCGYQDSSGNLYAVCSAQVTDTFMAQTQTGMRETPPHAVNADRALAQVAFDSLGQPGGLMMVVGDDAMAAIASMGLELVPVEDGMQI